MQAVGASCDGLTVSVLYLPPACTSPTLLLYDTRGLLLPSPDSPFDSHVLNTSSSSVTGVHWNPTIAATFCVTFADGALAMYTLGVASGNVGGANCDTLPPATGVVAISWSPKGKQMVAVKKDGSLTQVQRLQLYISNLQFNSPFSVQTRSERSEELVRAKQSWTCSCQHFLAFDLRVPCWL